MWCFCSMRFKCSLHITCIFCLVICLCLSHFLYKAHVCCDIFRCCNECRSCSLCFVCACSGIWKNVGLVFHITAALSISSTVFDRLSDLKSAQVLVLCARQTICAHCAICAVYTIGVRISLYVHYLRHACPVLYAHPLHISLCDLSVLITLIVYSARMLRHLQTKQCLQAVRYSIMCIFCDIWWSAGFMILYYILPRISRTISYHCSEHKDDTDFGYLCTACVLCTSCILCGFCVLCSYCGMCKMCWQCIFCIICNEHRKSDECPLYGLCCLHHCCVLC